MGARYRCPHATSIASAVLAATIPFASIDSIADEGRVAISAPLVLDATTGDSIAGRYIVTSDIETVPGSGDAAIAVLGTGTEEIDIDLNGFALLGDGGQAGHAIRVANVRTLRVRNGKLGVRDRNTGDGINVVRCSAVVIEEIVASGVRAGIYLTDPVAFRLERNTIADTYKDGIIVGVSPGVHGQGIIAANSIRDTRINGILASGDLRGLVVRDNVVHRPGLDGLSLVGVHTCTVSDNTVYAAGAHGVAMRSSGECRISENVVNASGDSGIDLAGTHRCDLRGNLLTLNKGSGIRIDGSFNHVMNNTMNSNGGAGLWFVEGTRRNTYGGNDGQDNGVPSGGCSRRACPGLRPPAFCDDGVGNISAGGNLLPGPPPC